jgi:hypothetical protein
MPEDWRSATRFSDWTVPAKVRVCGKFKGEVSHSPVLRALQSKMITSCLPTRNHLKLSSLTRAYPEPRTAAKNKPISTALLFGTSRRGEALAVA